MTYVSEKTKIIIKLSDELKECKRNNEALREYFNAHLAVENGLASMDLHNEAVDRLTKARDALLTGED